MNTYFKFVDEIVFKPYLASKGLNRSNMTPQSITNQRTRAAKKWDALMTSIDLMDVKHNSRRWIIVNDGEFSIAEESQAPEHKRVLPYDSFTLGFADYAAIVELMRSRMPHSLAVEIETNVTADGHARLKIVASSAGSYVSTLTQDALKGMQSSHNIRTEFYLDPTRIDPYSNQFTGKVTDNLAFWMGDVVDAIRASEVLSGGMRDALISAMRSRRGAATFEYKVPTHDTTAQFAKFLDGLNSRFADVNLSRQVIKDMPVAKHGKLASRRWGIEVETGGARGVSTPSQWDRKYDGSLCSAYSGRDRYIDPMDCDYSDHREYVSEFLSEGEEFYLNGQVDVAESAGNYEVDNPDYEPANECEDCGDVYYDDDDYNDGDCAEFVSPILKSFHSRGLEQLIDELSHQPQNDSAGIHVHVEAKDLTPKQVGSLVVAYQVIEKLITSSYNRERRNYCKERRTDDVVEVMRGMKKATKLPTPGEYDSNFYTGDRYHSVNLCALSAHGTIEFRSMGPVTEKHNLKAGVGIDYDHLIKWASFCREMVNVAAASAPIKAFTSARDFNDVVAIFAKYGKEVPAIISEQLDKQLQNVPELQEV